VRGGFIIVSNLKLDGSIDDLYNPVGIAALAVEKWAQTLLLPVIGLRQLLDLSDDRATEIELQFYKVPKKAPLKALVE
jgi:ATP-dependent Lon protease